MMICVTNSVGEIEAAARAASGITSKTDKNAHGYGSRIVKKIVHKYDGEVVYSEENGTFCAKAMLALRGLDEIKRDEETGNE